MASNLHFGPEPPAQLRSTDGRVALIDQADVALCAAYSWCAKPSATGGAYFRSHKGSRPRVYLHRLIMAAPTGVEVDHISGDPLDNRRANLRLCNHAENVRNRSFKRSATGYKGVKPHRRRWQSRITVDGRPVYLGSHPTAEDAARAYDAAARRHFGEFARLNFPGEHA